MNVIKTNGRYQLYSNSLETYNKIPAGFYTIGFNPMQGFSLLEAPVIQVTEKIYGNHKEKVDKIMKSFSMFDRNLGVILSGDKGIGKSLCAKMIAERAAADGYPLIAVSQYIPGIADYISNIDQEVVLLFDEFDKTFFAGGHNDSGDPQTEMLSLFDGLSVGKKLFVITCNELRNLSDYLVNRPGRFHYHLRFEYPNDNEIKEYLNDKLLNGFDNEIEKVIAFAHKVPLNYDCLRAIAFELSSGLTFEDAIKDLNIINIQCERYNIICRFTDGTQAIAKNRGIDLFSDENVYITDLRFTVSDGGTDFDIQFNPTFVSYKYELGGNIVNGENVTIDWIDGWYSSPEEDAILANRKNKQIDYVLLQHKFDKNIHYSV